MVKPSALTVRSLNPPPPPRAAFLGDAFLARGFLAATFLATFLADVFAVFLAGFLAAFFLAVGFLITLRAILHLPHARRDLLADQFDCVKRAIAELCRQRKVEDAASHLI